MMRKVVVSKIDSYIPPSNRPITFHRRWLVDQLQAWITSQLTCWARPRWWRRYKREMERSSRCMDGDFAGHVGGLEWVVLLRAEIGFVGSCFEGKLDELEC